MSFISSLVRSFANQRQHMCRSRGTAAIVLMLLATSFLVEGCGPEKVGPQAPVDQTRGKEALISALDAWKAGKKPEDLAKEKPMINVQDVDWIQGAKLVDYKLTDKIVPQDQRLFVDVQLDMLAPDGKKKQKTVKYTINTSPVLSVFRQFVD